MQKLVANATKRAVNVFFGGGFGYYGLSARKGTAAKREFIHNDEIPKNI